MTVIKRASFLVTALDNLTTAAYKEVILEIYDKLERDEFDPPRIRRMIARNASSLTEADKREIINALFGEE